MSACEKGREGEEVGRGTAGSLSGKIDGSTRRRKSPISMSSFGPFAFVESCVFVDFGHRRR